jgi:hypothetical protein
LHNANNTELAPKRYNNYLNNQIEKEQKTREYAAKIGIVEANQSPIDELNVKITEVKEQNARAYASKLGILDANEISMYDLNVKISEVKEQKTRL